MHKALNQMGLQLQHVLRDVTGVTGLAIIRAILRGERDPRDLAKLRHERCHNDEATIAKALEGNYRSEHVFALQQGRKSALRREIPWILRGFQGRLSC